MFPNSDFDFGTWVFVFWNGAGGRIFELGDSKVAEPFIRLLEVNWVLVVLVELVELLLAVAVPKWDLGRNLVFRPEEILFGIDEGGILEAFLGNSGGTSVRA